MNVVLSYDRICSQVRDKLCGGLKGTLPKVELEWRKKNEELDSLRAKNEQLRQLRDQKERREEEVKINNVYINAILETMLSNSLGKESMSIE